MVFTERQRLVIEANLARDRAETLLTRLLDTSRVVQHHNSEHESLAMGCLPSLDRAISSTRRLVAILNDSLQTAEEDLADEDLALLDELARDVEDELDAEDSTMDAEFDVLMENYADADDPDGSILDAIVESLDANLSRQQSQADESDANNTHQQGPISISPNSKKRPPGTMNRHRS